MMSSANTRQGGHPRVFSRGRRVAFGIVLLLFPLLLLLLVELGLRVAGYGDEHPLFVDTELHGVQYRKCNPTYGQKYFHGESFTSPPNDMFLTTKPSNGFRIFVIGSSTVVGFPYHSGVMFSRILHQRLHDAFPHRHVEVVNTAITAVNSFTFFDRIDEILRQEPDAILIYGGHNEFYGALGIGSRQGLGSLRALKILHLRLLNLRTYQLLRDGIVGLGRGAAGGDTPQEAITATLMERIVRNRDIEYDGPVFRKAHDHYRRNMASVLRRARRAGVPVFYSSMVSNVRDLPPFGSSSAGGHPPAMDVYRQAQALEAQGDTVNARLAYLRAKDLDCIRFRASQQINTIIAELSQRYQAIHVPMLEAFERHSPLGIVGNSLLTEHVHPNVDGYFLMADVFFQAIVGSGIMGTPDPLAMRPAEYYRRAWGFTSLDSLVADLKVRQLMGGWPFQPDTLVNRFIRDFRPANALDSAAIMVLRYKDITIESAHRRKAGIFRARGQIAQAAAHHLAITRINPWDLRAFIEAGELLLASGDLDRALAVSRASLRITQEPIVLIRIGQIYNQLGDYPSSLEYLRRAQSLAPDLLQHEVLTLLREGYLHTGRAAEAEAVAAQLAGLGEPRRLGRTVIVYTHPQVQPLIERAMTLLRANQLDQALGILREANAIAESGMANRLIGEVLLTRNNPQSLAYLRKAYWDFSTDPTFMNTLCYASIRFNDLEYARRMVVELRQLSPQNPNLEQFERSVGLR